MTAPQKYKIARAGLRYRNQTPPKREGKSGNFRFAGDAVGVIKISAGGEIFESPAAAENAFGGALNLDRLIKLGDVILESMAKPPAASESAESAPAESAEKAKPPAASESAESAPAESAKKTKPRK